MILVLLLFFKFMFYPVEKLDLKTIPHEWVHLSEEKGEYVRYNSCDAGNLLISVSQKNGGYVILHHGQQEDFEFTVNRHTSTKDTIEITTTLFHKEDSHMKFAWIDKDKQVACWITQYPNGGERGERFVSETSKDNFKEYNQPCKECWDECDE